MTLDTTYDGVADVAAKIRRFMEREDA